jgi:tight adherence protein B
MLTLSFLVFVASLFMTYGAYLALTYPTEARRARLERRLQEVLFQARQNNAPIDIRLARQEALSDIPWLSRLLSRLSLAKSLQRIIEQADLHLTVMRLLLFSGLAGVLAMLAMWTITSSLLLIVTAGLAAMAVPVIHIILKRQKRLKQFLELLPDSLELMARSLAAGHAMSEALRMIASEMPEPISTEFKRTFEEQNLGLSLKLALDNLGERVPLIDLRLCITAILIQRETGGNLSEILDKVAATIRERFRIQEDLRTLTTSSRMSAYILAGLPIFVAIIVTGLNPDYMAVLWIDPRGNKLIALGVALQILGLLTIKKILRIQI